MSRETFAISSDEKFSSLQTKHLKLLALFDKISLEHGGNLSNMKYKDKKIETLERDLEYYKTKYTETNKKVGEIEWKIHDYKNKYEFVNAQYVILQAKVKDLEQKFLKRGQTDQTIFLNKVKGFDTFNPGEGLGFSNPNNLQKVFK